MNVLVISSSPRIGGNSNTLADQFAKGSSSAGHNVTKVNLHQKRIEHCIGCESCVHHAGVCIYDDDMSDIKQSLLAADVIVLATPVYFYCMSANLKAMIDRCYAFYSQLNGKSFWLIATCEDEDPNAADSTITSLRSFLRCINNATELGVITATGVCQKGDVNALSAMSDALNAGKNL